MTCHLVSSARPRTFELQARDAASCGPQVREILSAPGSDPSFQSLYDSRREGGRLGGCVRKEHQATLSMLYGDEPSLKFKRNHPCDLLVTPPCSNPRSSTSK